MGLLQRPSRCQGRVENVTVMDIAIHSQRPIRRPLIVVWTCNVVILLTCRPRWSGRYWQIQFASPEVLLGSHYLCNINFHFASYSELNRSAGVNLNAECGRDWSPIHGQMSFLSATEKPPLQSSFITSSDEYWQHLIAPKPRFERSASSNLSGYHIASAHPITHAHFT